ncbi:MAG TPA: hypothetical protein EYP11_01540 [Aquificaceae bacterium]|nr:hypothetical protein [Aquificaceae bacterium]HIQ31596.1 hypothetical protein [Aquifex aeolicus]
MKALFLILSAGVVIASPGDPFLNKEDAVGYIVIEENGKPIRYIVIEGKDGKIKLIKTRHEPEKILKQGGKK